ncbi:splicing factor, suppressor of white-apricot homolog isoform X2 [Rhodamnia argentea]|uniref:Splicing factor, suppressor of white-apricot homolog isoform X2 n=1 Tax=Rhodamnia argentea TaxID=178133 RepID=A0A8B8Q9B0_9MYRT|nr:splicing factor, suppressor of white-apricot homolog isoform X2 [Rhodamnia argentea]
MDLEVVGRHALLFDDDPMAAFVNSPDALVDWHSLSIDRYDVRHLLSAPPPPRKARRPLPPAAAEADSSMESELDRERYLDLPPPTDEQEPDAETGTETANDGGYHVVAFSYGKPDNATDQKTTAADTGYRPPFPVPEYLLQNMPPTEKVHQIIARTAMFVGKHGGQSEIILRVKHGDNPTFGFLMPDHHLHPYFRFLVDHQELLKSDAEEKSLEGENTEDGGQEDAGGALSLLGATYGSGEDEDETTELKPELEEDRPKKVNVVTELSSDGLDCKESSTDVTGKERSIPKHPPNSSMKEKASAVKKNRSTSTVKAGAECATKKGGETLSSTASMKSSSLPSSKKVEQPLLEPPSDVKRLVNKIVEFIVKNGEAFESVLIEQDKNNGRFPFLLPSNQYYHYYLKVLQKAQQSKLLGNKSSSEKTDAAVHVVEKNAALSKDSDSQSVGPDIPYESDRKGKFKMVIGKSKKDGQDQPSRDHQQQIGVSVDAAAAVAILQAARRGIKNPTVGIFPKTSLDTNSHAQGSESGEASSFAPIQNLDKKAENNISLASDEAIARTAAVVAASEADSSEASLTKEQKLKAERLKRAKMFAALLKSGAAPSKTQLSRGLSVEPLDSGVSGSAGIPITSSQEREDSSFPVDFGNSDINQKSERKTSGNEQNERRSKRKYRSRAERHKEEEDEEEQEGEEEEEREEEERADKDEERDHKHSRKKRRSHRAHHSKERHRHRKRHSSSKDKESRHRRRHDSFDDEQRHHRHRNRHDSSDSERRHSHRRNRHDSIDDKLDGSSGDEHMPHHRHKHNGSLDDKELPRGNSHQRRDYDNETNRNKSGKYRESHSGRKELEEGEISAGSSELKALVSDRIAREASTGLSNTSQAPRAPSEPSEPSEVPNDLRAKIRAMLMATM